MLPATHARLGYAAVAVGRSSVSRSALSASATLLAAGRSTGAAGRAASTGSRSLTTTTRPTLRPASATSSPGLVQRRTMSSGSKSRYDVGVFTLPSAAVFVATGIGLVLYFRHEKQKLEEEREKENAAQAYGRPKVGGPFALTATSATGASGVPRVEDKPEGTPFTDSDLLHHWSLLYFGFTNCPDICPAELDKMGEVVRGVESSPSPTALLPIFITVDPQRDTLPAIARYLADFHPRFVGLRGGWEETKSICRAYRVYFSTPPDADPAGDYLVDHSIFVYLVDPEGHFVDAFGQNLTAEDITQKVEEAVRVYGERRGGSQ
ncbi:SCO1 protein [Schizophyllum commune H4-8]|uniref:SCO1 protein n=1 Tax=Schizophyllum commune (strain H4-8 / FGSC 9210) TaxID=578458 RepID=UPI002160314B|nr:SCO1 protein [Schizophyllum commune H4-8]KAI5890433.1 SCO1 protein [Schizophyllum commune H4-8]